MDAHPTNWKKTFFLIWTGQSLSMIGSQMVHFAVAWWLTRSTGSAIVLATISIFGMLPQVILGPFIGALVDRWNRRRVMVLADSAIAVVTLGLAVLFLTAQVQFWHLYVVALVRSTLGVFHWTAMQASTSLMVPKEQLARVAGMNQTLMGILNIAAPPLGALVVELLPMGQIMLIDVVTAALAITPLLFVRIPQPANISAEVVTPRQVMVDVRDGLRYLSAWPGMLIFLGMAMMINFLLSPTGAMIPLLVTRHFEGGVWHLSALESGFGLGIIGGGLLLSIWGGFKRRLVTSLSALVVMGVSVLMVGTAPRELFLMAVVGNTLAGVFNVLVNGPLFALLQDRIAPEMQGRVFSLVGSMAGVISPLGMALAAPVSDYLGIQVWWRFGGIVCILMGLICFFIPAVMKLEEIGQSRSAAAEAVSEPAG